MIIAQQISYQVHASHRLTEEPFSCLEFRLKRNRVKYLTTESSFCTAPAKYLKCSNELFLKLFSLLYYLVYPALVLGLSYEDGKFTYVLSNFKIIEV